MKDGLENSFKEALNHFEIPYDAQAWESLNKKLSAKKWYQATQIKWSAALVIAIGVAAYFVLTTSNERNIKETHNKTAKKETNSQLLLHLIKVKHPLQLHKVQLLMERIQMRPSL